MKNCKCKNAISFCNHLKFYKFSQLIDSSIKAQLKLLSLMLKRRVAAKTKRKSDSKSQCKTHLNKFTQH